MNILGDEMDGKLRKCEKDLDSLIFTMKNLQNRNEKLKKSLINEKTGVTDRSKKQEFEIKLQTQSKEMWEKKNELEKINYEIQLGEHSMREKESQVIYIY